MGGELCGGSQYEPPKLLGKMEHGMFIDHNEYALIVSDEDVLTALLTTDGTTEDKGFLAEYYSGLSVRQCLSIDCNLHVATDFVKR